MLQRIYESSPIAMQNLFCTLYGLREKRVRYSEHYYSFKKFLDESQYWSEDEIQNYKVDKIKTIYQYCYENIPFYRNRFKHHGLKSTSIKELDDLKKLPILSKEDIRSILLRFRKQGF